MDARIQAVSHLRYAWHEFETNLLVWKISCDPFFAGNPDLPSKLQWVRTGDSFMLVQKSLPQQISLVPAKIRLVGSIPSGFSSLTDHLVWSRAQRYPLCKYTGIAVLDAGDVALAKMLWDPCKIGLARLQDLLDVEGGVSTVGNDGTVTIQHCLFEVCHRVWRASFIMLRLRQNIKDMDRYVITQDLDVVEPQIIPGTLVRLSRPVIVTNLFHCIQWTTIYSHSVTGLSVPRWSRMS